MPAQIPGTQQAPPPPMPLSQLQPGQTLGAYNAVQSAIDPATMTAGGQLNTLMQSSSPLEQLARAQGMNAAAARGSANGTLFAGASMAALNDKLQPIALNDANAYLKQQQQNQAEANQSHDTMTSAEAQEASAGISANASMYGADVNAQTQRDLQHNALAQNQQQFETNWANEFQTAKNSQAFQTASQATQNEFTAKMTAFQSTMQTVLSDPSYWNNPDGATGMVNYFTHAFDDIWSSTFGNANPNSNVPHP